MKLILFLFLLALSILQTSALEFSPTVLKFQTTQNVQSCKEVFFVLDSSATLSDIWAENENMQWRVTEFQTSAQQHQIQLNYPSQISADQTKVGVCLTQSRVGNYHGALVFRQGQTGNSIVQFVVWLNASITGANNPPDSDEDGNDGSSSRSRSRNSNNVVYQQQATSPKQNFEELSFPEPQEKITLGNNQKEPVQKSSLVPIIIVSLASALILVFVFVLSLKRK